MAKRLCHCFFALSLWLLPVAGIAQDASFLDLWCKYGGDKCNGQKPAKVAPQIQANPKPTPVPVPVRVPTPVSVKSVEKTVSAPELKPRPAVKTTPLITRNASAVAQKGVSFGRYYALVIGNNAYQELKRLKTAVKDAREIAKLLKKEYGFSVTLLEDVTRDGIISALDEYRKILKEEDNLLIYYAGHGWLDEESERGYWLPIDASTTTRSRWVSNADVTDTLKALKAKHVMVVADSCYAGTLTRSLDASGETRGLKLVEQPSGYLQTMLSKKSRTVMASGGLEPVTDQGGGEHSIFAYAFLKALKENKTVMDGTQLFGDVRKQVMLNAYQTPQYNNIRFAGHDVGGDFIFIRP